MPEGLFEDVATFVHRGEASASALSQLALRMAVVQAERIPLYAKLCALRGIDPRECADPARLPAIPSEAFKRIELHTDPASVVRRFGTSGTSGGEEHKGVACYSEDDLALMDLAIDVSARCHLFPDHKTRQTLILVLAPPPELAPQMIMGYGMQRLIEAFGLKGSRFLIGRDGLDGAKLGEALGGACAMGIPVTLIGASFGFVNLFDAFAEKGQGFALPEGSRAMDAGGFKGRSREVSRAHMLDAFKEHLGLAPEHCVNLLGLTEFASQFYEDNVAAAFEKRPARKGKQNPPWTKTWAVDPESLAPLPHGETGLLRHLDLCNGGHPFIVQTDDLGQTHAEGFEVLGRAGKAEARGCSITVDELMAGQQGA